MENSMTRILAVKRLDTTQSIDVTEDFSLPDYIPEVRRVVGVQSNASVDGKYLNGGELEADGSVSYTVLYIGGDGGLCAIPLNTSFDGRVQVKAAKQAVSAKQIGGDGGSDTFSDVFGVDDIALSAASENVICRVTAPRRLTLSSKVKLRAFSQRRVDCGERIEPSNLAASVKLKRESVSYGLVKTLRTTVECGGELREREGTRVVSARGCVMINETKGMPEGVAVSGEARVSILLLSADGVYMTAKSRSGIETLIPCETSEMKAQAAVGRCLSCEVEVSDDGLIAWNMECDIDCDVLNGGSAEISTDGYSTGYEDTCDFEELDTLSAVKGTNGRLTVSGTKQIRPDMTYAGGWGRGVFEKAERNGRHLVLSGSAVITSLLCGNGEAVGEECVIPVKYECETDAAVPSDMISGKCEFTVCDVSGRCDGETLHVNAEIGVSGVFLAEKKVRYLSGIRLDPDAPIPCAKNVIRICIPDGGETEWDVMKRYRVSADVPKKSGGVYMIP